MKIKIKITKTVGKYAEDSSIGKIHLIGHDDRTACGLALEDYDYKPAKQKVDCSTCLTVIDWCHEVAKHIQKP